MIPEVYALKNLLYLFVSFLFEWIDVFADSSLEQEWLLRDVGDVSAQQMKPNILNINPINNYFTLMQLTQSKKCLQYWWLASTRSSNNTHLHIGLNSEGEILNARFQGISVSHGWVNELNLTSLRPIFIFMHLITRFFNVILALKVGVLYQSLGWAHQVVNLTHEPDTHGEKWNNIGKNLKTEWKSFVVHTGSLSKQSESTRTCCTNYNRKVKPGTQLPLEVDHSECSIAAFIKVINENSLKVWKSFESSQRNKSTNCICKIRAKWSSVHTVQSLGWICNIDHSMKYFVHK